jgi:hypothetical protein
LAAKKKRKATKRKRGSGRAWSIPRLPAPVRGLLIAGTIVALLLVLVGIGLSRIRAYVGSRPGHRVRLDRVRVLERPSWVSDDELEELLEGASISGSAGFYDPDLARRLRDAWGRTPLAASLPRVAREHPNRVRLSLSIRRPVVGVKDWEDEERPIVLLDREAVRWPGRFPERVPARFGARIPIIKAYDLREFSPTPPAGHAWRDERVLQGLAVALDLRRELGDDLARRLRIRVINVENVGKEGPGVSEVVLETEDGMKVEWGRSSGSPRAERDPPVRTKIESLRRAFREPARLPGMRIKVQFGEDPILAPEPG